MKLRAIVLTIAAFTFGGFANAQHSEHHAAPASAVQHQASGKVTKVDRAAGRVTIAHGPVASLKWPPMTMAFEVKDKALFDKLKPGSSVEFAFVQAERKHVITEVK